MGWNVQFVQMVTDELWFRKAPGRHVARAFSAVFYLATLAPHWHSPHWQHSHALSSLHHVMRIDEVLRSDIMT